jgi:hypothetical protein
MTLAIKLKAEGLADRMNGFPGKFGFLGDGQNRLMGTMLGFGLQRLQIRTATFWSEIDRDRAGCNSLWRLDNPCSR